MEKKIIIAGLGNLGKHYLQGLSRLNHPLGIWLYDSSSAALDLAFSSKSVEHLFQKGFQIHAKKNIHELPNFADITILTTTANARPVLVKQIFEKSSPKYWILEKFLSQSHHGLEILEQSTIAAANTWVNLPRRSMAWHRCIKEFLVNAGPFQMHVFGGNWGMACNAVHYIDLCNFWFNESILKIKNCELNPFWIPSKREGCLEVMGTLDVYFSKGSFLRLECCDDDSPLKITIQTSSHIWSVNEKEGLATRSDGFQCNGRLELQSELTGSLVESILKTGNCLLPDLQTALPPHRALLSSLLEHWNMSHDRQDLILPIT